MHYHFKNALHIAGKDFPRGVHEVPEKCENHPHFLKYVGLGLIEEAEKVRVPKVESTEVRAKKLLDKLVKQQDAKKAAAAKPKELAPEVPAQAPVAPESSESESSEEAPKEDQPKGHGKPKKR